MKTLLSSKLLLVAAIIATAAGLGYFAMQSPAETSSTTTASAADPQPQTEMPQALPPQPEVTPVAPAQPVLPKSILPTSPLAQVIKLAQAGLDQSILMAYVTNSRSTFNLDSEKIIYATDAGVPAVVVTAMMQHDQQLYQALSIPPSQPQTETQTTSTEPAPAAPPTTSDVPDESPAPVTINYFYNTLSPYGAWINVPGYGNCWRPNVAVYDPGWAPYCDRGYWAYTDCGWYWYSDYSWNCTFHYGRWFRDPRWGWCWWPDTVWGPSWVTWRYSDDYCGWAPLPPFAVWQPGFGFVYHGNGVSVGFDFGLAPDCFVFVPSGRFCDVHLRTCRVPIGQITTVYNHTTVINNININIHRTVVNNGIAATFIARATHRQIEPTTVHELRTDYNQRVSDARRDIHATENRERAAAQNYVDQRIQNEQNRQQQQQNNGFNNLNQFRQGNPGPQNDNSSATQDRVHQQLQQYQQNVANQNQSAAAIERQAVENHREQLRQQIQNEQQRQSQAVQEVKQHVQQQIEAAKSAVQQHNGGGGQGQGNGSQGGRGQDKNGH
ncbi:MAG TPA: DUF6600 domain-containing protein [Verrucomicrobiae bacterium]|nr:DUF6600 domain-containing protein [Verrucomicrobiae bacterium]